MPFHSGCERKQRVLCNGKEEQFLTIGSVEKRASYHDIVKLHGRVERKPVLGSEELNGEVSGYESHRIN